MLRAAIVSAPEHVSDFVDRKRALDPPTHAVMSAVMELPWDQRHLRRCSILLIFEKLANEAADVAE
jgi:hypothetical protein